MKHLLPLALSFAAGCTAPDLEPDYGRPLPPGAPALLPLDPGEPRPNMESTWVERADVLPALERSMKWTRGEYSREFFPIAGISHAHALASLERFHELLTSARSAVEFEQAVQAEFEFFKSAGWDGRGGGVLFTGYCTPILPGRAQPDGEYRYALYALPPDLVKAPDGTILGQETPTGVRPYPTRRVIEASGHLTGKDLELVWLRDPLDAFIAHVNGSAFVELPDGSLFRLGYAGKNGREYTSLGAELIADGLIEADGMSLAAIRRWSAENPGRVEEYLARNDSFVFFTPIEGNPRGSLNLEVQTERTLATDKRLFPRGAMVFVDARGPLASGGRGVFRKLLFDQDTGGAIRTAGRADVYLGIGPEAEARAGATRAEGQMYYLFQRRGPSP